MFFLDHGTAFNCNVMCIINVIDTSKLKSKFVPVCYYSTCIALLWPRVALFRSLSCSCAAFSTKARVGARLGLGRQESTVRSSSVCRDIASQV